MSHDPILDDHILNIVQTQKIFEQVDLQQRLNERGYDIPQATLSRRLKKLKIAKVSGVYTVVDYRRAILPLILSINVADNGLIVLHTEPGNANNLASFIDKKYLELDKKQSNNSGILGTIAGDDTVLLIIKNQDQVQNVVQDFYEAFPYLNKD